MIGDGICLVDKPAGCTSHDVVARVRRAAGTRKVGHAGTLDPMATGLLVLGVNRATRLLTYLVGADKTYRATIRLGQGTITDDAEGEVVSAPGIGDVDDEAWASAVARLKGPIEQVPSAVSAIKVDGRRSYARVRAGEQVELAARPVTVHAFDVLDRRAGSLDGTAIIDLDVQVRCSSGTYVRALARDLGASLGSAGHLTALRRTAVADFAVTEAQTLQEVTDTGVRLLSMTEVARRVLPVRQLTDDETVQLRYGRRVAAGAVDGVVAACAPDGHVVALLTDAGDTARPVLVLDPA